MADAKARKAVIKKATSQVRTGGAFVRRASTAAGAYRPATSGQTAVRKSK